MKCAIVIRILSTLLLLYGFWNIIPIEKHKEKQKKQRGIEKMRNMRKN